MKLLMYTHTQHKSPFSRVGGGLEECRTVPVCPVVFCALCKPNVCVCVCVYIMIRCVFENVHVYFLRLFVLCCVCACRSLCE